MTASVLSQSSSQSMEYPFLENMFGVEGSGSVRGPLGVRARSVRGPFGKLVGKLVGKQVGKLVGKFAVGQGPRRRCAKKAGIWTERLAGVRGRSPRETVYSIYDWELSFENFFSFSSSLSSSWPSTP